MDRDHQPEAPTSGGPGRGVLERLRAFWYELGLLCATRSAGASDRAVVVTP